MGEIKCRLSIPKMQLLQMKTRDILEGVWLEIENISLSKLSQKYPTINKEETGNFLRELLMKKGISIKAVQEYLGLSCVQSIYHWLDGKTLPSIDNLYALSQLLQVPLDSLIRGNRKELENPGEEKYFQRIEKYNISCVSILEQYED